MKTEWILHKVVIPTAVLTLSAAILLVSYRYHERQLAHQLQNAKPTLALAHQIEVQLEQQNPTNRATKNSRTSSSTPTTSSKTNLHPASSTTVQVHGAKVTTKKTPNEKTASQQTPVPSAKWGSAQQKPVPSQPVAPQAAVHPVIGGTVADVDPSSLPDTSVESVVVQSGPNTLTSGIAGSLTNARGNSLTLPTGMDVDRLLAVSLNKGVIWAILPATASTSEQTSSPSVDTTLMYTPFPLNGQASLTTGAIILGNIPSLTSELTLGLDWSNVTSTSAVPVTNTSSTHPSSSVTSSNTTSVASNDTLTTSTSTSNVSNISGSQSPPSKSNPALNQNVVTLSMLAKTAGGAVITIDIQSKTGSQTQAAYLYDESTNAISRIANLPNDGTQFSWLAVGRSVVYYGTRTVNQYDQRTYTTNQVMYHPITKTTTRIGLGTTTEATFPHGDQLVFQVQGSNLWKVFTPN